MPTDSKKLPKGGRASQRAKGSKANTPKKPAGRASTKTTRSKPEAKPKPEGYVFGRPTLYRQEYCGQVIEWGKQGKSVEWIAATLMVSTPTIYEWCKTHEDFSSAITLAKQLELKWWEDKGQDCLTESGFSSSTWSRSMAARFPNKWREKQQVDHGVTDALASLLGQLDGATARML